MIKEAFPILALRGLVVLPGNPMTFDVGRQRSIKSIEAAVKKDNVIFLIAQKDPDQEEPTVSDLHKIGTICVVKHVMHFSEDKIRVIVEGLERAELLEVISDNNYLKGNVRITDIDEGISKEIHDILFKKLMDCMDAYLRTNRRFAADFKVLIQKYEDNLKGLVYEIINILPIEFNRKQDIFDQDNLEKRTNELINCIMHELDILNLEREIQEKVQSNIGKMQKDSYLREQLKVIKSELGDVDSESDIEEYKKKIEMLKDNKEVYEKAEKEVKRLAKMPFGFAEASVINNYLDVLLSMPWDIKTEEKIDLKLAEKILNDEHYGLGQVKERILEYLAVRKITGSLKGPVLCFVGPPGVGKTSIAKSIAASLNRKYVRMSLGGVKDEAEIRGHRKTYIGAMPGRIITAIRQAGTKNPLILLDEIDKMGSDYKGDPTAAMLEVLDTEQNYTFRDHFLELPFDLSEVLFICTANSLEGIPGPLRDRMELIEVSSYTEEEKLQIALRHLFPKQLSEHGLSASRVKLEESAMTEVIKCYTAEAGVRSLEREIAKLCRRIAKLFAEDERKSYKITCKNVEKLLGTKKRIPEKMRNVNEIGVCTGLAWTSIGGVILNIEVNVMLGTGKLELTGHLGEVMKESALAAMSFIRSRIEQLHLEKDFYSKYDIHIHIPEGATPKDGPSAGITLATAMVSALTGIPCRNDVAMTGEITLRGRVLAIGGLKEKALAAYRAGIKKVIIPVDNIKDLDEIPADIKDKIKFAPVAGMDEVFKNALLDYKNESFYGIMNINSPKEAYTYDNI